MKNCITIKGARENNLKNIDLVLPRDELIVFTGLSGSGKSSLAFETIFAEGQRRYVESLSSYARQFLGQMDKPDVDYIEGLSPAVSIDQKSTSSNPRSTVGTVTEINDYLRLLFARIGVPHCPKCGREITRQSIDQVVDAVKAIPSGSKIQIIAPLIRGRKGEHVKVLDQIRKDGYVRVKIDGDVYDINETPKLDKNCKHDIDVIIDRIVIKDGIDTRLSDSLETAFSLGQGLAKVDVVGESEMLFSQHFACPDCGISIEELSPRMFSFNNPYGACPSCSGLGYNEKLDVDRIIPDKTLSIAQGAIDANGWSSKDGSYGMLYFKALAEQYGFSLETPWCDLTDKVKNIILYGTGDEKLHLEYEREFYSGSWDAAFEGIIPCMERRYNETKSDAARSQ
ncbi:MAG: excinuclease ABC subunit UvrA, partial [Clostridiales bacterium]|nr:excinuclease ABC subunit UvrA [Clostridiales bacterium]